MLLPRVAPLPSALLLVLTLPTCGGDAPQPEPDGGTRGAVTPPSADEPNRAENGSASDPASVELPDFQTWAEQMSANPSPDPVMDQPEEWFQKHFKPEIAAVLVAEYQSHEGLGQMLVEAFEGAKAEGRTNVVTETFIDHNDWEATGGQSLALEAMSTPAPLHSIRLIRPGETKGLHIWSFSELDGRYVFVGKMLKIRGLK